jgi:hypothetical protein
LASRDSTNSRSWFGGTLHHTSPSWEQNRDGIFYGVRSGRAWWLLRHDLPPRQMVYHVSCFGVRTVPVNTCMTCYVGMGASPQAGTANEVNWIFGHWGSNNLMWSNDYPHRPGPGTCVGGDVGAATAAERAEAVLAASAGTSGGVESAGGLSPFPGRRRRLLRGR